jgi:BlaI family transcriptional regulator, penicillinase repressor
MAPKKKLLPQLTRLELQIMKVLWEKGPATVQEVQKNLKGESLAYTTVQTMLNVLHRKGRVKRKLYGKAYQYAPLMTQDKA